MNISPYHIQNVIRSYGQRVARRGRLRENSGSDSKADLISISAEGKKNQLTEKIAQDILSFMKADRDDLEFAKRLMVRLGTELGGRLESLPASSQSTGFKFKVVNPAKEETIKELSLEDIKAMIGKVADNT